MADRQPFVLGDAAVVALAASAAAGAWRGGGPGLLAGGLVLVGGLAARRPVLLAVGIAVIAAGLADRAMAGLDPVPSGPVEGWVVLASDPEPLASGATRVIVSVDGRRLEATAFGAAGSRLAERLAGEQVEVSGRRRPPPVDAPWLVPRRVVGRLMVDEVRRWEPGSFVSRVANGFRRTLTSGAAHLPRTARSLLAGVVLGDDREQPPEISDDFRAAGLTHLLVVSGQNVAFVLAAAGPVLTRLRWRARLPATATVLVAFAFAVRFEPSVLRAGTMAAVATTAAALGRPTAGIRVLALAVAGLVLVDPLLVRSVGFGLSVAASGAILVLAPCLRVALPGPGWLVEPLAVTIAAQVGTMPLLLATFGVVPLAAVPANLLAVPAAGPLMVWGLTGGVLAGISPAPVAAALHVPTALLAWWLAAVARWGASLPLGTLTAARGVALGVAVLAALGLRRRRPRAAMAVQVATLVAVLVVATAGRPSTSSGRVAVGSGAALVGGRVLLVESAGNPEEALEGLRRAGPRCVGVVAVVGGGRSAAALAGALRRRCPGAVIVAPAGRAHPGWTALADGAQLHAGGDVVVTGRGGTLIVESRGSTRAETAQARPDERRLREVWGDERGNRTGAPKRSPGA